MDAGGEGGSLAGLKVTQYDKSFLYDATGTQPMDVSAVDEGDIDFGHEDLEVAVLERKTGCYNCRRLPSSFSTASWSFADDDALRDDRDDDDSLLEGDPTTTPKFAWPRA